MLTTNGRSIGDYWVTDGQLAGDEPNARSTLSRSPQANRRRTALGR
ncbi:MAG: hypothetical protein VKL01_11920 [Limnothrix sp.]|nr:hypothetical protein [Limnothrix sp.]